MAMRPGSLLQRVADAEWMVWAVVGLLTGIVIAVS
jgi:hypothetical protein